MLDERTNTAEPLVGDKVERQGCRRRLPPEERRAAVLTAALEVFVEMGFERATLQDVADRAGVTKGALYHYFDSKNELYLEVIRDRIAAQVQASQALVAAAEPSKSREELLRQLLEAMWHDMQQPGIMELIKLLMAELPKFPECGRAFFEELVVPARRPTRSALERGESPSERDDQLIDIVVAVLPTMLLGVGLSQGMFKGVDPIDFRSDQVGKVVIDILLQGALAALER
ncbi:MAG TPA: TetR/AcrR family transcriptional regulator [Gemmatimonadales bacterium]|nr:TetR/AcrR family transcriptional regulator [Gemmatimonadales bacterium]